MASTARSVTVDEKIKAIPIEQQNYINGFIDGILREKKRHSILSEQPRKPPENRPA